MQWRVLNLGHYIPTWEWLARNPRHDIAWCAMACPDSEAHFCTVGYDLFEISNRRKSFRCFLRPILIIPFGHSDNPLGGKGIIGTPR